MTVQSLSGVTLKRSWQALASAAASKGPAGAGSGLEILLAGRDTDRAQVRSRAILHRMRVAGQAVGPTLVPEHVSRGSPCMEVGLLLRQALQSTARIHGWGWWQLPKHQGLEPGRTWVHHRYSHSSPGAAGPVLELVS